MQLNITTDYAIRMLLSLGQAGKKIAGPAICGGDEDPAELYYENIIKASGGWADWS